MSTIKVDTLQTRAGTTAAVTGAGFVATDQIRGNTAANSVTVVAEGGTVTTNLQQGLAKAWCQFDGAGTIAYAESFNGSSLTDLGVGRYQNNITSAMNTTTYPVLAEAGNEQTDYVAQDDGNDHNSMIGSRTATAQRLFSVDHDDGVQDDCQSMNAVIFGDLA